MKLTPEQEAQFMSDLQQQDGIPADGGGEIPPDVQEAALQQGAEMAEADAQAAEQGTDVPEQAAPPAEDAIAQLLEKFGFQNVEELATAFENAAGQNEQMKSSLAQLLALEEAQQNEDDLDPNAPDYAVRKIIRDEMSPVRDKIRDDMRNQMLQAEWGAQAADMPDLSEFMPDISEYLKANPNFAVSKDGLSRAYDAVRSKKYQSKEKMLEDPAFIKEVAGNEAVRKAVLEEYLGNISRNGDVVPTSIGDGGGTPLTGKKKPPTGMEQAKNGLLKALGEK